MPRLDDPNYPLRQSKAKFIRKSLRAWSPLEEFIPSYMKEVPKLLRENETKNFQLNSRDIEPETNRKQTDNLTGNKPETNYNQTGNKSKTNLKIEKEKEINWKQTDNLTGNKPETNHNQIENKPETNFSFFSLIGLQKKIAVFLYNSCKNNRSKITNIITLEHVSCYANCDKNTAKTTLRRLETKKIIIRKEFKNGRGGWSKYEIPEIIYNQMLIEQSDNKPETNHNQTGNKLGTQPETNLSSSSSYNKYNTSSTRAEFKDSNLQDKHVQEDFSDIDIEPLRLAGMTPIRLKQIVTSSNLTTEQIQNSIYAFAFDLKHNDVAKKIKAASINYFMGIVMRGRVYEFPQNYISPEEDAMRTYLQRLHETNERKTKQESEAKEVIGNAWLQERTAAEIEKILDEHTTGEDLVVPERPRKKMILERYFNVMIWPGKFQEILNSTKS